MGVRVTRRRQTASEIETTRKSEEKAPNKNAKRQARSQQLYSSVYYAAGRLGWLRSHKAPRSKLRKDWQQAIRYPGNCSYKASPRHIFPAINNWKPWQSQIIRETTRNSSGVTQAVTHLNYRQEEKENQIRETLNLRVRRKIGNTFWRNGKRSISPQLRLKIPRWLPELAPKWAVIKNY